MTLQGEGIGQEAELARGYYSIGHFFNNSLEVLTLHLHNLVVGLISYRDGCSRSLLYSSRP